MSDLSTPTNPDVRLLVFDIQRFCLHDGPGIRTTLFFKGCPLKCLWCQNPESFTGKPEIAFYAGSCQRCFYCADACDQDAIQMDGTHRVDYPNCNTCGKCVSACVHRGLRLIGRGWNGEALLDEVLKDLDHYSDSGGGLTLSGGEPVAQARTLACWLPRVKEHGIHIMLETCGYYRWEQIERLLPSLDLIYFDLKHMDSHRHREVTGQPNELILENFKRLSKKLAAIQARMPVIPGMNDNRQNILATAHFLRLHGHKTIHCLPYHNLGESKIPRINAQIKPLRLDPLTMGDLHEVTQTFEKEGIHAIIYD